MTCEEYLLRYRCKLAELEELDAEIEAEELKKTKVCATYDCTPVKSSGDPSAKLDTLGDLVLRRKALEDQATEIQGELRRFIASVGNGQDPEDRRCRQLLRLYYSEGLAWNEVQGFLRPLRKRNDGRAVSPRKQQRNVSSTTLFRERNKALALAERAYRQMHKYS